MSNQENITIPPGKIQFYDSYVPTLKAGAYTVHVQQTLDMRQHLRKGVKTFRKSQEFIVAGPRFRFGPRDVHAVYPPPNSEGHYRTALPHIVLRRRALPWLYNPAGGGTDVKPWLALLLFTAEEMAGVSTAVHPITDLPRHNAPADGVLRPDIRLNQADEYAVSQAQAQGRPLPAARTIDVPGTLFQALAPGQSDIAYLAHVRQVNTGDKELLGLTEDGWFSVVLGNRLPVVRQRHVAHLVSLEGWYGQLPPGASGLEDKQVRLVSLASWSFTVREDRGSFSTLMAQLDPATPAPDQGLLRVPVPDETAADGTAAQLVRHALKSGYVPLNYRTRLGETAVAWFRGPLLPVAVERVDKDPFASAEAGLIYDPRTGMFDVSYAVAWQIGRLLALADREFATALARWRQQLRQAVDAYLERQETAASIGLSSPMLHSAAPRLGREGKQLSRSVTATLTQKLADKFGQQETSPLQPVDQQAPPPRRNQLPRLTEEDVKAIQAQIQSRAQAAALRDRLLQVEAVIAASSHVRRETAVSPTTPPSLTPAAPPERPSPNMVASLQVLNQTLVPERLHEAAEIQAVLQDIQQHLPLPESLRTWLARLSLLYGVPFANLAPDERMLPPESIRFFYVDANWLEALIDGALSAGVQSSRDVKYQNVIRQLIEKITDEAAGQLRRQLRQEPVEGVAGVPEYQVRSGFLLRSAIVSGWPGLEVQGYASRDEKAASQLPLLRLERLAPDVLLCIFAGVPELVVINEPAEGLHFGVTDEADGLKVQLRSPKSGEVLPKEWQVVPWRDETKRVIDIHGLCQSLGEALKANGQAVELKAGDFAIQMIEGAKKQPFKPQSEFNDK